MPDPASLVIRSERVVFPDGERAASVHVHDGRIVDIAGHAGPAHGRPVIDAGRLVILPGLVDTHVHLNDPGRAEWEGFDTGTRAAAAGGVTTVVDMPLNSIPATTSVAGLQAKLRAARERCHVDVGFWGGVVPGNTAALAPLAEGGVRGFKCFLSPSGVDEFAHVTEPDLRAALPVLARLDLPLLVHAELPALLRAADADRDPRDYRTWLECRPCESEHGAIALLIRLAREYRTRIHVVHLASSDALAALRAARAEGVRISVETCPHYLSFAAEDIAPGATAFKCAPPIRERRHREALWDALAQGEIDLIATDHSPAPPALKGIADGDFIRAWGGVASLQTALPAVWTGTLAHGLAIDHLALWLAEAPARLAGLSARKGAIAVGRDADFAIFDPGGETVVDPSTLHQRHPMTPYAGMRLEGQVCTTILRGEVIFDRGGFPSPPRGRLMLRGATGVA